MPEVASKLDTQLIETTDGDVWADFRQIERITVELTQRYRYTLGKTSRFFLELENRRFMATQCGACSKVYAPPRPFCPTCYDITEWVALSGEGTVKTFSVLHFASQSNDDVQNLEKPFIMAYVLLDGASTLFPHILKTDVEAVHIGMRVKVNYVDEPVHHPLHLMYFTPLAQTETT
ncbi:MAG: Zn-ribbon domain-containing OB-fold protein [Chloroflexota bacterium]